MKSKNYKETIAIDEKEFWKFIIRKEDLWNLTLKILLQFSPIWLTFYLKENCIYFTTSTKLHQLAYPLN